MVSKSERVRIKEQRTELIRRLTEDVLHSSVSPLDPDSTYRVRPTDPALAELYDQAGGDPGLYALLTHVKTTQDGLIEAKDDVTPEENLQARDAIAMAKLMVQQYIDPLGNPLGG